MIQRASGAVVVEPRPRPAETSATAGLRSRVTQRVVVAVRGAYRLPAAKPTTTPKKIWNWPRVAARLAITVPKPIRVPPRSTTTRVPSRSESAPQTNDPMPMHRKLSRAAVEMPVRDQPVSADIGWRKTPSENIAPNPIQVTNTGAPTVTPPEKALSHAI